MVDGEPTGLRPHFPTRHGRKLIKGHLASLKSLQRSLTQREPSVLPLILFTMLFSNTLVSFVAAIALASSVTASVTPVRRGGGDDGKPSQSCSTGSLTCCSSSSSFAALPELIQSGLASVLDPNVLANAPIGLNCDATGLLGWYCALLRLFYSMANVLQLQYGILLFRYPEPESVPFPYCRRCLLTSW